MWELAVREEDFARSDSLIRRKFAGPTVPLDHRAILAIVSGDSAGLSQMLAEARRSNHEEALFASQFIALYLRDFMVAERFARIGLAPGRAPIVQDSSRKLLASLDLAQGRWRAAAAGYRTAEGRIRWLKRFRALSATFPFLAVPRSELLAIRDELERWEPNRESAETNPDLAYNLRPHLRLYLLGLLSSRLGDAPFANRYATELELLKAPREADALIRDLSGTVRADVALRRGRAEEALATLQPVGGELPLDLITLPFYSEEHSRYLRAEALYGLGRYEEALRWFQNSFEGTPNELVYLAPAYLRQAEIYERLGDREQATIHYGRFIQLWKNCDAELQPQVQEAKARMARLVGEPRPSQR